MVIFASGGERHVIRKTLKEMRSSHKGFLYFMTCFNIIVEEYRRLLKKEFFFCLYAGLTHRAKKKK